MSPLPYLFPRKKPSSLKSSPSPDATLDEVAAWVETVTPDMQRLFEKHHGNRMNARQASGFEVMLARAAQEHHEEGQKYRITHDFGRLTPKDLRELASRLADCADIAEDCLMGSDEVAE